MTVKVPSPHLNRLNALLACTPFRRTNVGMVNTTTKQVVDIYQYASCLMLVIQSISIDNRLRGQWPVTLVLLDVEFKRKKNANNYQLGPIYVDT